MKKAGFAVLILLISLTGFSCSRNTKSANSHTAEWLDESMVNSLDTLKRVDEEGILFEMTCDYDYYNSPVFKTLLSRFGQYDAGRSSFTA